MKDIIKKLFSMQRFGIKPGLSRTKKILSHLEYPHHNIQTVHIAGTNGKGTVATALASILTDAGYKTGLYTSPHIKDFNERFSICGWNIFDKDIERLAKMALDADVEDSTFFEITTAMAFKWFAENNVDIAIFETGMGGRYDSTNVLIRPLLSIITSIGIDHSEYLGSTLEEIAAEKAGIIKPKVDVLIDPDNKKLTRVFREAAEENMSRIDFIDNWSSNNIRYYDDFSMSFDVIGPNTNLKVDIPLAGPAVTTNILLSSAAAKRLNNKNFTINDDNIINGLKNIRNFGLKARAELISNNPPVIVDIAHNHSAFVNLRNTLENVTKDVSYTLVFGAMKDKNVAKMLEEMRHICNDIICIDIKNERAMPAKEIAEIAKTMKYKKIIFMNSDDFDIDSINQPTVIAGSFFLIDELYDNIYKKQK